MKLVAQASSTGNGLVVTEPAAAGTEPSSKQAEQPSLASAEKTAGAVPAAELAPAGMPPAAVKQAEQPSLAAAEQTGSAVPAAELARAGMPAAAVNKPEAVPEQGLPAADVGKPPVSAAAPGPALTDASAGVGKPAVQPEDQALVKPAPRAPAANGQVSAATCRAAHAELLDEHSAELTI